MINVYAPTEYAETKIKDEFYEQIEVLLEATPKEDTTILLGDLNAQIGQEEYIKPVAGRYTIHNITNDNGQRLCELANKAGMIISSTKYQHPFKHKITWMAPGQRGYSQIDHILINKRMQSAIRDVRTYRGACADSDHFMVAAKIKQKVKRKQKNKENECLWAVDNLRCESTRKKYRNYIEKKIEEQSKPGNDTETEWNNIKALLLEAAQTQIGKNTKRKHKEWFNEQCVKIVAEKREKRMKWIKTYKEEDRKAYETKRKECNKTLRKIKREWMDEWMDAKN